MHQGKVAGDYLASHFKGEKIAILNDNSAYGKGPGGRDREGAACRRRQGSAGHRLYAGREGLFVAGQPAEAGRRHA